jgi:hypothetical protein
VEDHHVDRLDVEARQRVKLTSTNSSIGLIVLINPCPQKCGSDDDRYPKQIISKPKFTQTFFVDLVAIARGPEPDPIPNSTVKSLCANGTKSQGLGE